jgi:cell division protein FtsB
MKTNRKRAPLRVGTVGKSVLTCVCLAAFGLAYVWQKNHLYRLGDEIKKREAALVAAEKRNTMLAAQLAQLQSPAYLEARCQQYGLGLVAPKEQQMVRLLEPGPEWDVKVVAPVTTTAKAPAKKSLPATKTVARR